MEVVVAFALGNAHFHLRPEGDFLFVADVDRLDFVFLEEGNGNRVLDEIEVFRVVHVAVDVATAEGCLEGFFPGSLDHRVAFGEIELAILRFDGKDDAFLGDVDDGATVLVDDAPDGDALDEHVPALREDAVMTEEEGPKMLSGIGQGLDMLLITGHPGDFVMLLADDPKQALVDRLRAVVTDAFDFLDREFLADEHEGGKADFLQGGAVFGGEVFFFLEHGAFSLSTGYFRGYPRRIKRKAFFCISKETNGGILPFPSFGS